MITPFWISALTVASAEMGDKTQLLALLLTLKFKKPVPIILGILLATLINHGLAAWFGFALSKMISPTAMHGILAFCYFAAALWLFIPDKMSNLNLEKWQKFGIFTLTLFCFFIIEIGDKTQIATIMLSAQYQMIFLITLGTTVGMLLANVPIVLLGKKLENMIPVKFFQMIATLSFTLLGCYELYLIFR